MLTEHDNPNICSSEIQGERKYTLMWRSLITIVGQSLAQHIFEQASQPCICISFRACISMQAAARLKVKPVKGKDKTIEQVVKGCEAGRSKAVRRVQSCVRGHERQCHISGNPQTVGIRIHVGRKRVSLARNLLSFKIPPQ